ncbi:MAG: hypothetical protein ACQESR_15395, partial [Planctomycetota bacterium]
IFQAVGFFRVESCPTQAVLPLVGLAAEKLIRDRHNLEYGALGAFRNFDPLTAGDQTRLPLSKLLG